MILFIIDGKFTIEVEKLSSYRVINLIFKNGEISNKLEKIHINVLENNPVTYIYYNLKKKKIYVGETNGFLRRHYEHLIETNPKVDYREYTNCLVVYSSLFDKSSILDLESLILNYMIAESDMTKFVLANGNNGQTELVYKNKEEILTEVFYKLWSNELHTLGLVDNPNIEELRESLLFKYSPFKQLSSKQKAIVEEIEKDVTKKYLVEAPAGSGKSVLFTNLAFSLAEKNPDLKIGLITTGNLTRQFNLIFKSIGLNEKLTVKTGSQLIMDAKSNGKNTILLL